MPDPVTPPLMGAAATVPGLVRIGRMLAPRETWHTIENPTVGAVLSAVPAGQDAAELAIEVDGNCDFVDVDTHHWHDKPQAAALDRWLEDVVPEPDAAWRTHGAGLRLMYVGPHSRARAVAAAMSLPVSFKIELKRISRHPLSTRQDKPGAVCGAVLYGKADPLAAYTFQLGGNFTPELRAQALEQLQMADEGRYDHDRCPINPLAHTDAKQCVAVFKNTVKCFRCEGTGTTYRPGLKPGVFPLAAIVGAEATDLERLAKQFVHWQHAYTELQYLYPNLAENVLREAYKLALIAGSKHGEKDPRLWATFSPSLDFVWGNKAWLIKGSFEIRPVDSDAANAAPYCQKVIIEKDKDGNEEIKAVPDSGRRSQFKNSTPIGYKPVRPYRGLDLRINDGQTVPVRVEPGPQHGIQILAAPESEAKALSVIEKAFPRINHQYLKGAIAAGICAARGGRKPQLCADGPSGAGKYETIRLAASFLGDDALKVRLSCGEEELARYIGSALVTGRRFLVIDELAKTPSLAKKFGTLLQFNSSITWRPLYRSAVVTDFDAALFYPSVNFPDWLKKSTEFCRRTRRVRLIFRVPEWSLTAGGDTCAWRDRNADNARTANSLLTHVYRTCTAHNYDWEKVADAIELGRLDDDVDAPDNEVYRELYRYCCGVYEPPEMLTDTGFVRGWVNLATGRAKEIIETFIDFDEADHKKALQKAKHNLEALPWNNILGYDNPPVRLRVRIHGGKWGCRFEQPNGRKGQELLNKDLPKIAANPAATPAVAVKTLDEIGKEKLRQGGVKI